MTAVRRRSNATALAAMAATLLMLMYALLAGARTAEATHAEAISITASSLTVGATDVTYTIEFRIGGGNGATVAGQGDVTVTFPDGFDVSDATFVAADSTVAGSPISGEYTNYQLDGQQFQLLDFTDVLADGTTFSLKFEGVDNPTTSGNQTLRFQVWSHTVADLGSINTNGSGSVVITGPVLDTFSVTAPGGGPIGAQTAGVPFQIEVAALNDSGDPFTDLDAAAYSVDITTAGSTAGSTGLGTVTLDFSATPGTATHTVMLGVAQSIELTVTSTGTPSVNGTSNTFNVVTPPDPEPVIDSIVEHGETRVQVINRRSRAVQADQVTTIQTQGRGGSSVSVEIPAGAIEGDHGPLRLEVAAVSNQAALDRQAPPFGGADVYASFVVRLVDQRGNAVDASFSEPVTLTFTLRASALPEDVEADTLVLSFWDGTEWVLVPATITENGDGTVSLVAEVSHFTLFQVTDQPEDWGQFTPDPRPTGQTFAVWHGGGYDLFDAELEGGTAWILVAAQWFTYSAENPAFVNAPFLAEFPDGVPALTAVIVAR